MQKLKRYVLGQRLQLEQVVHRVYEEDKLPLLPLTITKPVDKSTDQKIIFDNFVLTCRSGNNNFVDNSGRTLLLHSIYKNKLMCKLIDVKMVGSYPNNISHAFVGKVHKVSSFIVSVNRDCVMGKCAVLPYGLGSKNLICFRMNLNP